MCDVISERLIAAVESEMNKFPANVQNVRERFNSFRSTLHLMRAVTSGGADDLTMLSRLVELLFMQSYKLADGISSLARLELAASDLSVALALMRGDAEETPAAAPVPRQLSIVVYEPVGAKESA